MAHRWHEALGRAGFQGRRAGPADLRNAAATYRCHLSCHLSPSCCTYRATAPFPKGRSGGLHRSKNTSTWLQPAKVASLPIHNFTASVARRQSNLDRDDRRQARKMSPTLAAHGDPAPCPHIGSGRIPASVRLALRLRPVPAPSPVPIGHDATAHDATRSHAHLDPTLPARQPRSCPARLSEARGTDVWKPLDRPPSGRRRISGVGDFAISLAPSRPSTLTRVAHRLTGQGAPINPAKI